MNPAKPPPGYYGRALTRDSAWDFWRTHNREWWYWRFFRPLVRVAAAALGESVATQAEPAYATERMVFVELCPYASRRFVLSPKTVAELTATDPGFRTAARVRRLLIDQGHPALVLVNGRAAVADFELVEQDRLAWDEVRYDSVDGPGPRGKRKQLWHKQGLYGADIEATSVPVVGFPFLKKPMSHNSNAEIEQLGERIRQFLSCHRMGHA